MGDMSEVSAAASLSDLFEQFNTAMPVEASMALAEAGRQWQDTEAARSFVQLALAVAPEHPAVLIGAYRFHFYKGELESAVGISDRLVEACEQVLVGAATPGDYGDYDAALHRLFLFSLKARGYLLMRLGRYAEGRETIERVLAHDPGDKVGARLLVQVLDRTRNGTDLEWDDADEAERP